MNTKSILTNIIIGAAFLTLLLPLFVAKDLFFPFITGKAFGFRILTEIIFFSWLYLAAIYPEYRPRKSLILFAVGLLLFAGIWGTVFGVNPYRSFWSNFERMEGLIGHLHFFAFFISLTSTFLVRGIWEKFLKASIFTSVIVALYALTQIFGDTVINQGSRVDATFGNSAYLAIYTVFHFFLALFFLAREKSKSFKVTYGVIALLNVFILYFTATRGAILGLIGGMVATALLILLFDRENKIIRRASFIVVLSAIVIIGAFFLFKGADFVKESSVLSRFADISLTEQTVESRFIVWNIAMQGFLERPITGWGFDNFSQVFNKYYDPELWRQEQWFDRAHNVVFDWGIRAGILGFFAYGFLFIAAIYTIWKKIEDFDVPEKSILTGLLLAYLFHNLFVFDNTVSYIIFFAFLGYLGALSGSDSGDQKILEGDGNKKLLAGGLLLVFVFTFYFGNLKPIYGANTLLNAVNPVNSLDDRITHFDDLADLKTFALGESAEQASQLATSLRTADVGSEDKQKALLSADKIMKLQLEREPENARQHLLLGIMHSRYGLFLDRAEEELVRALELSPKKQHILFELGTFYVNNDEPVKGLSLMKEAFEEDTDYGEARVFYGITALLLGQEELAKSILEPVYGSVAVPDRRFIRLFLDRERYDLAILATQKLMEEDKDFAEEGQRILDSIQGR